MMCMLVSCGVIGFKHTDRPICLVGGKNGTNDDIDVRAEEGPIHSTGDTYTHYVVQYRIGRHTITLQEPLQVT